MAALAEPTTIPGPALATLLAGGYRNQHLLNYALACELALDNANADKQAMYTLTREAAAAPPLPWWRRLFVSRGIAE